MSDMYQDLHIHSCLSPCADDDMTPSNICGMAYIKGLNAIAITDHNSARNLPSAKKVADAYGLLLIPGMEITTKEEVHALAYFKDVPSAMAFSDFLKTHLPKMKNRPSFFGNQWVVDEEDHVVDTEDALLIGATDIPLKELQKEVINRGGILVPAHINRGANGLLMNFGFMPPDMHFPSIEVSKHLPCPLDVQKDKHILYSSDAHRLGDILEKEVRMQQNFSSPEAFIGYLQSQKNIDLFGKK